MITVYSLSAFRPELKGLIRDIVTVWTLEELGLPYTRKVMDSKVREHKQPPYLAIHPFGKVPAIEDDGFTLFESSAICTYLADKTGRLAPKAGTRERAVYDQWCAYSISTFGPFAARVFNFDYFVEKDATTEKLKKETIEIVNGQMETLNQELSRRPYLLGDAFSIPDILLSAACRYVIHAELAEHHPKLKNYLDANYKRPAFVKAYANNG